MLNLRSGLPRAVGPALALAYFSAGPAANNARAETQAPTTRSFAAQVLSGTGRYADATGRTTVLLTVDRAENPANPSLAVSATLTGLRCPRPPARGRHRSRKPCARISGTIKGAARYEQQVRFISDQPSKYVLEATTGVIDGVGPVTVVGTLKGTGFVDKGRPTLWIALSSEQGTVSIGGVGPLVGGFALP
jgi:hypothetical protein